MRSYRALVAPASCREHALIGVDLLALEILRALIVLIQPPDDPLDPTLHQLGARFGEAAGFPHPIAPKRRRPQADGIAAMTADEPIVAQGQQARLAPFANGEVVDTRSVGGVELPAAQVIDRSSVHVHPRQ